MLRQKFICIIILIFGSIPDLHASSSGQNISVRTNHTAVQTNETPDSPYLLLISLDGFRHDYLKNYQPPFLKSFVNQNCARLGALTPVFPSKTFPNHWSLITGDYADQHGIVGNSFLDKKTKAKFSLSSPEAKKNHWYKGEPFWLTVKKNGLKSASYFWPGSDVDRAERRPDYYRTFDKSVDHQTRIDQIITWFSLPVVSRPRFITLYFSDVDTAGHIAGPDSEEVKKAIFNLDSSLRYLWNRLMNLPIPINVVIVSDHGMQALKDLHPVYLSDYLGATSNGYQIVAKGPVSRIYTDSEAITNSIYDKLIQEKTKFKVYKRKEIPSHYHYSGDENIGDLLIVSDAPYFIFPKKGMKTDLMGEHGYDPYSNKNMGGIFYAKGPKIKGGFIEKAEAVQVYPFLKKLMGFDSSHKKPIILDRFLTDSHQGQ